MNAKNPEPYLRLASDVVAFIGKEQKELLVGGVRRGADVVNLYVCVL